MTKQAADTARRGRKGIEPSTKLCATVAPCVEELTPFPDPWDVARRLACLPHLLLLESAAAHPTLGRYSFVTADPFHWLRARGSSLVEAGADPSKPDTAWNGTPLGWAEHYLEETRDDDSQRRYGEIADYLRDLLPPTSA